MTTTLFCTWQRRLGQLKTETYAIYLAFRDPRVPWYAKILFAFVIGYAFSPVDKLLNSIPVLAYLDHLFLVPLAVVLAFRKMIPPTVFTDCREKARIAVRRKKPNWVAVPVIVIWFLVASLAISSTLWVMKDWNLVVRQWLKTNAIHFRIECSLVKKPSRCANSSYITREGFPSLNV